MSRSKGSSQSGGGSKPSGLSLPSLEALLARGYFPKELPTPFTTKSFAALVASSPSPLPGALGHAGTTKKPESLRAGKPAKYSLAKGGWQRRPLSLPHPIHQYLLSHEVVQSWSDIARLLGSSPFSATNPTWSSKGRAISGAFDLSNRPRLATAARVNKRYVLKTDIAQCYASVYTHAIPWAIMGKQRAKANRRMSDFANRLDFWMRMGQGGETVGIPIGPDTSLLAAELILQHCDTKLAARFPGVTGYRFIDDYELGFRERSDAETAYNVLEGILGEYQLSLNPRKTEVLSLPLRVEKEWVRRLRAFSIRESSDTAQRRDLMDYFDEAFELRDRFPTEDVLQYALGRLRYLKLLPSNWLGYQRRLLLCAYPEPSCLLHVLSQLIERVNSGLPPDGDAIGALLNALIVEHAPLPHSSETAWAIWAAIAMKIGIDSASVDALSKNDDCIVALLALHAQSLGLMSKPLDLTIWTAHMSDDGLYDDHWLLAYEAYAKGWLPSADGSDYLAADPAFSFMRSHGVAFYEGSLIVPEDASSPIPVPLAPSTAIAVGDQDAIGDEGLHYQ